MITRSALSSLLVSFGLVFVAGCDKYALDTCWRSQNYRLIAKEARGQMSLIDTSDKGWSGVGATIFSIGADETYIVVAQHPSTDKFGGFDRSITRYFVVERNHTPSSYQPWKGVRGPIGIRGPLSKAEFDRLTTTLALPAFNTTFEDLK
jgi:hypothetical protein